MNEYVMDEIESFWKEFLASLPPGSETGDWNYSAWSFGNRPDLADELGALVVAGLKTATCTLLMAGDIPLICERFRLLYVDPQYTSQKNASSG
jgi:hypothetical protein